MSRGWVPGKEFHEGEVPAAADLCFCKNCGKRIEAVFHKRKSQYHCNDKCLEAHLIVVRAGAAERVRKWKEKQGKR